MYYIGISEMDSNKLTYYCRHCGHVNNELVTDGMCVLDTKFKKSEQKFSHIINPYTKMDPTLPRIHNVKCPNGSCTTNNKSEDSKASTEVIYIRYDDQNLKYLYICVECDYVWKTNDQQ
jgi:DNA-directed RNA polymerase subunit M/transcription elongation factor TFIIS